MDHGGLQARFSHCLSKCFREISLHFHSEGRWGGGIVCQDSLKHILWRSILGFLPRTVLADNTPPQLQLKPSTSIRNHWLMILHTLCYPIDSTNQFPKAASTLQSIEEL